MVCIVPDTIINLQDVVPDEPDKVREVGSSCFVRDKLDHPLVLHFVNIEGQGPDSDPDHAFTVVKELYSFSVEGKVIVMLIVEEMNSVLVQAK